MRVATTGDRITNCGTTLSLSERVFSNRGKSQKN
jgi:hypothetical protein